MPSQETKVKDDFFCEPDSTYVVDGIQTITYKSKHFLQDEHIK